jgi:hypothetical protein
VSTVPESRKPWYENPWIQHIVNTVLTFAMTTALWYLANKGGPPPVVPPLEPPVIIQTGGRGWINDPDAVNAAIPAIAAAQGLPAEFAQVARGLLEAPDDNQSLFIFQAEQKVLHTTLGSWDQGPVGTCVSFGWGRGAQDLMLMRVAASENREQWPGHEVATEPIYGGSRVEIGKGRIRGDGSVGAWAAEWVQQYGLVLRQKYGNIDLSTYSPSLSRTWGRSGVPADLELVAKQHPVTAVARLANGSELWAAVGNGYSVPVCSDVGFEGNPPSDGIMSPRGTWGHCMLFRGRFVHPTKGKCFVVQNSWGNYLGHRITVATQDAGDVELPEGCFAITQASADKMVREGDTFALSSLKGFPRRKPREWITKRPVEELPALFAVFTLAP